MGGGASTGPRGRKWGGALTRAVDSVAEVFEEGPGSPGVITQAFDRIARQTENVAGRRAPQAVGAWYGLWTGSAKFTEDVVTGVVGLPQTVMTVATGEVALAEIGAAILHAPLLCADRLTQAARDLFDGRVASGMYAAVPEVANLVMMGTGSGQAVGAVVHAGNQGLRMIEAAAKVMADTWRGNGPALATVGGSAGVGGMAVALPAVATGGDLGSVLAAPLAMAETTLNFHSGDDASTYFREGMLKRLAALFQLSEETMAYLVQQIVEPETTLLPQTYQIIRSEQTATWGRVVVRTVRKDTAFSVHWALRNGHKEVWCERGK